MLQDGGLPGESQFAFDSTSLSGNSAPAGDYATIPDAQLLFHGDYKRAGDDLKLTGEDGNTFLVHDYFKGEKRPALVSSDGASLSPSVVEALAGPLVPGQYAQAGSPQPSAAQAIGRVAKVEGNATIVRNGVAVTLNVGDAILKGDVAQTGSNSAVSLVFTDGTTFALTSNARIVMNEFVYSPNGTNNSALISLVQGSVTFLAGQVAKTGDMKVDTPVATMGIRGTLVKAELDLNLGTGRFTVLVERDGTSGAYTLVNRATGAMIATVNQANIGWTIQPSGPLQTLAQQFQLSPTEMQAAFLTMQNVFNDRDTGQLILEQNPIDNNDSNTKGTNPTHGSGDTPPVIKIDVPTPGNTNNPTNSQNAGTPPSAGDQPPGSSVPIETLPPDPDKPPPTINLAPLFESQQPQPNVEDNTAVPVLTREGVLKFTDVADTHTVTFSADPNHDAPWGTLEDIHVTADTTGPNTDGELDWSYVVGRDARIAALGAGETHVDYFRVTLTDSGGNTAVTTLAVTIVGVNDEPTVAAETIAARDITATAIQPRDVSAAGETYLAAPHNLINNLGGGAGLGENVLAVGDDNSTGAIDISAVFGQQGLDFFGHNYTSLYINNNGSITFGAPTAAFTPSAITGATNNPIIAVFWADVDTRGPTGGVTPGGTSTGTNRVYYDLDSATGVFTVTWDDVGYYSAHSSKLNAFQLQLINTGNGNFDIVFRYEDVNWTTGDASGGSNGLGGSPARAGYSAGDGVHYFELPQSGNQGSLLALESTNGNTGTAGVDIFEVQSGNVVSTNLSTSGVIKFTDPEIADTHSISQVAYTGVQGQLGTLLPLVLNSDTTGTGIGGQFTWTYNVASSALAYLGANETKIESFDLTISDNHGGTVTQTVSVTLHGVNDAPLAHSDNIIAASDVFSQGSVTIPGSILLTNDVDPDHNDSLTVTSVGGSSYGSVTLNQGNVVFTLSGGAQTPLNGGSAGFNYTIQDQSGASSSAHITLTAQSGTELTGSSGDDILVSSASGQTLAGGAGDDLLIGQGGADTFQFAAGSRHDQVDDFSGHWGEGDLIQLNFGNINDFADIQAMLESANNGQDTLIHLSGNDSILLKGVAVAALNVQDFAFLNQA